MLSFDDPSLGNNDQELMDSWATSIIPSNYNSPAIMPASQAPAQWSGPPSLMTDVNDQTCIGFYEYSPISAGDEKEGGVQQVPMYANIPRTWPLQYEPKTSVKSVAPKTYGPSAYVINDNKNTRWRNQRLLHGSDYNASLGNSREFARLSISRSSRIKQDTDDSAVLSGDKFPSFVMPSRESSSDSGNSSGELAMGDAEGPGSEEPYAKLIYRALMSKPNRSMVLQDIYQWFRENTVKGKSDTKGWMNSIRHNLSMNAVRNNISGVLNKAYILQAFKKMQRKMSDDETKQSTEWVLEDFAVKDGVQSTTRYRKRTSNQISTKSENRIPSRQSSGRKGGICASKTRTHGRRIKQDRPDSRCSGHRLEMGQYNYQHRSRSRPPRELSPLTPCPVDLPSASPNCLMKNNAFDPPYEDLCLDDVQGVYTDDSGPLFSNAPDSPVSPFQSSYSLSNTQHY